MFNDLTRPLGRISRSISPENITGEPGMGARTPLEQGSARHAARDLGDGWKVNPYTVVQPGETVVMADIAGMGVIRHIWCTVTGKWRNSILRMYWDGQEQPSVETPIGDFFCMGWQTYCQSIPAARSTVTGICPSAPAHISRWKTVPRSP